MQLDRGCNLSETKTATPISPHHWSIVTVASTYRATRQGINWQQHGRSDDQKRQTRSTSRSRGRGVRHHCPSIDIRAVGRVAESSASHAALEGNRGLAQKLLAAGAAVGTALHAATVGGHREIANDLLDGRACVLAKDTNMLGETALEMAITTGQTEMMKLLLHKGAGIEALDSYRYTPLCVATSNVFSAPALVLLATGADVSVRCGHDKESVLHEARRHGSIESTRAVIEHGVHVDAVDEEQFTSLHCGAAHNQTEVIDELVGAGASIEAHYRYGSTSLHDAASTSNLEALLALLKHGADINSQTLDQETPLHYAAAIAGKEGAAEVVDSLLRAGADETILNYESKAVADVVAEEDQLAEDVERVRGLLANALAHRAWRRRGHLVLCRSHAKNHAADTGHRQRRRGTQDSKQCRAGKGNKVATLRSHRCWTLWVR